MSEPLFVVWLAAIGTLALFPLAGRISGFGFASLTLPIGAASYILSGLVLLVAGDSFSTYGAMLTATGAAIVVALLSARSSLSRIPAGSRWTGIGGALLSIAAYGLIAAAFNAVPLTQVTTDSFRYLISAETLERTGSIVALDTFDVRMRHLGTPLLHTVGAFSGRDYSAAITPTMAMSGLGVMIWLATSGFALLATPRRWRWALLGSAMLLLLTTNRTVFHAIYLNGHMFFAIFLLINVGVSWIGAVRRDPVLFVPAGLALGAMATMRPEAAITVAIFVLPFLVDRRIETPAIWYLIAPFSIAVLLWNGLVFPANAAPADLGVAGPVYGPLFIAAGVVILAAIRDRSWTTQILPHLPKALVAILALYILGSTISDPNDAWRTVYSTVHNIVLGSGRWGAFWWVVVPLLILAARNARFPFHKLWTTPIALFGLAYISFAFLRGSGYRVGSGDSGNRILMHIALVAITYLVVAGGAIVHSSPGTDDEPAASGAPDDVVNAT